MKPETAGKIKFSVWGLICGAVIAIILGFAWGGVDNLQDYPKDERRGGLGESGGDLRGPIYEATEPRG
jgi:hypothetical protein